MTFVTYLDGPWWRTIGDAPFDIWGWGGGGGLEFFSVVNVFYVFYLCKNFFFCGNFRQTFEERKYSVLSYVFPIRFILVNIFFYKFRELFSAHIFNKLFPDICGDKLFFIFLLAPHPQISNDFYWLLMTKMESIHDPNCVQSVYISDGSRIWRNGVGTGRLG